MSVAGSKPAILCAGRLYCDLIFTDVPRLPSMGTEVFAGGLGIHAGGGAFITGAYLAALGHPAGLACVLPAAPFGDVVIADLDAAGLDLRLSRPLDPAFDPQVTVAIAGQGDRAFLTRRSGPAAPEITVSDLAGMGVVHLHIGELATLVEQPSLLSVARAAGATVSLDCGWDEDIAISEVAGLLPQVDVFFPNEAEAAYLRARGVSPTLAPLVVIKKGADGATAMSEGAETTVPAEAVQAVDTTGAGDAFNAGFVSAWLAGQPLAACLRSGNTLGARAVSGRGGFHAAQPNADAGATNSALID